MVHSRTVLLPLGALLIPRTACGAGLELQLLQGDPSLAYIRDVLKRTRGSSDVPDPPKSLWLREQLETGALPRDPELLRTLIEQARRDPELVQRLITQAKDRRGEDLYTRRENDVSSFDKDLFNPGFPEA